MVWRYHDQVGVDWERNAGLILQGRDIAWVLAQFLSFEHPSHDLAGSCLRQGGDDLDFLRHDSAPAGSSSSGCQASPPLGEPGSTWGILQAACPTRRANLTLEEILGFVRSHYPEATLEVRERRERKPLQLTQAAPRSWTGALNLYADG